MNLPTKFKVNDVVFLFWIYHYICLNFPRTVLKGKYVVVGLWVGLGSSVPSLSVNSGNPQVLTVYKQIESKKSAQKGQD